MKSKMVLMALLWPVLAWSATPAATPGTSTPIMFNAPSQPFVYLHMCDPPNCNAMVYQNDLKTIFSIARDGTVTLGSGVAPDDAARAFWNAVGRMAPVRCPNDKTKPK